MSRTDPEHLATLSMSELEHAASSALERVETRSTRAQASNRDLTAREAELSDADRSELVALKSEIESRERNFEMVEARGRQVQAAADARNVETRSAPFRPTLLVGDDHLAEHATALREGRPYGAVETRALVTAGGDLGSAGAWAPGTPNEPRYLIQFAGIPVSPLTGKTAQVPQYTGPAGASGADEAVAHGEYDTVNPVSLSALRFGRWTNVSALANVVDDLSGVNQMHAWGIARDLDKLAVAAIETAASTPAVIATLGVLEQTVRQAILSVAAATYSDEGQLVIVGTPADLAPLTGTTPTNGTDRASIVSRFGGALLYPSTAATAHQVSVFAPNAFRVFQTRLQSASLIDPTDGSNKFGSWLHSTAVAEQIVGAALAVATQVAG